jgi:hypothetical protein
MAHNQRPSRGYPEAMQRPFRHNQEEIRGHPEAIQRPSRGHSDTIKRKSEANQRHSRGPQWYSPAERRREMIRPAEASCSSVRRRRSCPRSTMSDCKAESAKPKDDSSTVRCNGRASSTSQNSPKSSSSDEGGDPRRSEADEGGNQR